MQFGHAGAGMHGQEEAAPSYPNGPQVGHLKLTAHAQSTN